MSGVHRLRIGLINNMPLSSCSTTERQFRQVLAEAASEQDLRLLCFQTGGNADRQEAIFAAELDGVIVTGAEPQSSRLRDEPIWPLITRLVDWGEDQALPMIWSCLAAHAAAFYLDGIDRVRLDRKISGFFAGDVMLPDHPLMQGLAGGWTVPHSRCNDLPEQILAAHGYRILLRSPGAGVDLFQKTSRPQFVFLQSHPEYDVDSLQREFHRDVRRFLAGERDDAPVPPESCFGSSWLGQCGDTPVRAPWRPAAVTFFRNWLRSIAARKARNTLLRDHREPGLVPC